MFKSFKITTIFNFVSMYLTNQVKTDSIWQHYMRAKAISLKQCKLYFSAYFLFVALTWYHHYENFPNRTKKLKLINKFFLSVHKRTGIAFKFNHLRYLKTCTFFYNSPMPNKILILLHVSRKINFWNFIRMCKSFQ